MCSHSQKVYSDPRYTIAATQPLVDKPRGGISGGGQAGTKTSVASKLNHAAEKSGAISTSTRNTITKGLRFLSKRLPYVGLGSSVIQLGDAIVDRIESETTEEQTPEPKPEPQRDELDRN